MKFDAHVSIHNLKPAQNIWYRFPL